MFGAGSEVRVIGHRGAAGVAPENTLVAIERGLSAGADAVEVDVHVTRDGQIVLLHDDTVDRTTDGQGRLDERTLAEAKGLDAGFRFTPDLGRSFPYRGGGVRIPTLDEAAEAAAPLPMVIEVKTLASGAALASWLRDRADRDRFIVGGFVRAAVAPAAEAVGRQCATRADLVPFVLLGKVGITAPVRPGISAFMLPIRKGPLRLVTRGFVRRAHRLGIGVYVWTVNRPDVMRALLELGVDGLISDLPARARRVVDEPIGVARRDDSP
jgi:glycerophosphoryl diester phosphodiesterase